MTDPGLGDERRRAFLHEWEIAVHSQDADIRVANQGAVDLGRAVLQTAIMLNGGALVLIPAYLALVREPMDTAHQDRIVWCVIAFIAGLVLAWLSAACAYFTMVCQGAARSSLRGATAIRLHNALRATNPLQFPELRWERWRAGERSAEELDAIQKTRWRWSERLRWSAIVLNFLRADPRSC